MIGDVVGDPGLEALELRLPELIKENSADFVIVNGENAAGGFGLTLVLLKRILGAGADVVTSGNHIWEKREFWPVLETEKRVLRPLNYPAGNNRSADGKTATEPTVGNGWALVEKPFQGGSIIWLVVNLQGRELMTPLDCPFTSFDSLEASLGPPANDMHPLFDSSGKMPDNLQKKPIIIVDFHAESSREKESLAYYLDGRVSVIAGTHTHVQTADERILPNGSAYITDLGMTGVLDGIIGMEKKICLDRARNQVLYRMEVAATGAKGEAAVQGIVAEIDMETKKAVSIRRL